MLNLKIPAGPAMVRLGIAAKMCGMTPEIFETGVKIGTIPVSIEHITKKIKLVRLPELLAWMNRHHHQKDEASK